MVEELARRVDAMQNGLPDMTDSKDERPVVTAVDVQGQLNAFKEATRRTIQETRQETHSFDEKIGILERARSETWELVSQRLNTTPDRTVTSLSERWKVG